MLTDRPKLLDPGSPARVAVDGRDYMAIPEARRRIAEMKAAGSANIGMPEAEAAIQRFIAYNILIRMGRSFPA